MDEPTSVRLARANEKTSVRSFILFMVLLRVCVIQKKSVAPDAAALLETVEDAVVVHEAAVARDAADVAGHEVAL